MRGEHGDIGTAAVRDKGIIPACAGSTASVSPPLADSLGSSPHARGAPFSRFGSKSKKRDHPHMRGEHYVARRVDEVGEGIIPACAGSTGPRLHR